MKNTEEIIASHQIDNASDAALVRLAGLAASMPSESVETLVKRVNFSHPGDEKLAHAIIEAVRVNPAPAHAPKRWIAATAVVLALAVGLGFLAANLNRELVAQRTLAQQQSEQFAREVGALQTAAAKNFGELQAATNSTLKTSSEATKENVQQLVAAMDQYVARVKELTAENAKLKLALEAAQAPKNP